MVPDMSGLPLDEDFLDLLASDVGVDEKYKRFNNWAPFSVEEIVAIMETKPIFGEVTD